MLSLHASLRLAGLVDGSRKRESSDLSKEKICLGQMGGSRTRYRNKTKLPVSGAAVEELSPFGRREAVCKVQTPASKGQSGSLAHFCGRSLQEASFKRDIALGKNLRET